MCVKGIWCILDYYFVLSKTRESSFKNGRFFVNKDLKCNVKMGPFENAE